MHILRTIGSGLLALILASIATSQSSGAIFTTNAQGKLVNGNTYRKAKQVYLQGGPGQNSNCSGSGLANGDYYFQVTNPSGSVLLSSDPITNRRVTALGGVIVSASAHALGSGFCPGSRSVQLIPFTATPNNGNEYKVWLTPVGQYDPSQGNFGFISKFSKTDNFKVVGNGQIPAQTIISGLKYYDADESATYNPDPVLNPFEVPIPGWRIEIYQGGVFQDVTFTDTDGVYQFIREQDGSNYVIEEFAPGGFIGQGIPGATWLNTTPRSVPVTANMATIAGIDFGNLRFVVRTGVGRTPGFWHNQNGAILLQICDPIWREDPLVNPRSLNALFLRNPIVSADPLVSIFTVAQPPAQFMTAFNELSGFLVGNPASGHAAYILSRQLAATVLNTECGFIDFTAYVDVRQDGVLVSLDTLIDGGVGLLSNPLAGLTGPQATDPAVINLRETILACINEFGGVNNTGEPSEPQIVYGPAEGDGDFTSPYPRTEEPEEGGGD